MTGFIISIVVMAMAVAVLVVTIIFKKKMELAHFLFLIAFEIIGILVAGWAFMIYGAIIEMGNI